jgi:hypothetical protein
MKARDIHPFLFGWKFTLDEAQNLLPLLWHRRQLPQGDLEVKNPVSEQSRYQRPFQYPKMISRE